MSKVKTYNGHAVPDGATCFVESCEAYKPHFGKEVDGIEYVFVLDYKYPEWNEISNILPLEARGAIELPEEEDNQERIDGLPPAGTTCLTMHKGDLVECLYIGKGLGEEFIYQVSSGCHRGEIDRLIGSPKFRPLKTQKEKNREAFIEWAKNGLSYRLEEQAFAYRVIEQVAANLDSMPKGDL